VALLNGIATGASTLDDIVRAATAPPSRGELDGLPAAAAVFRSADLPVSQWAKPIRKERSMLKAIVAGATLTKLIAGAAAAAAAVGGGVVLAAHSTTPPPANPGNSSVAAVQTTTDRPAMNRVPLATARSQHEQSSNHGLAEVRKADDTDSTELTSATHELNASQIAGLCTAWQAHVAHPSDHGKWMSSTAFRELASVATGGSATTESTTSTDDADRDAVTAYCDELADSLTTVTGAGPNGAATTHPTRPAMPTQATVHPTRPAMPTQATVHATRPAMPTQATVHPTRPAMPTQVTAHPAPPTGTTGR
jgi:hypothetical protein